MSASIPVAVIAITLFGLFGPVAALVRFTTEPEVVEMANDTPYGLAGARRAWLPDLPMTLGDLICPVNPALEVGA